MPEFQPLPVMFETRSFPVATQKTKKTTNFSFILAIVNLNDW